jgi:N-methylhydantoinase A/oxoprolinase/acetone carboxylase beta subunit
MRIGIDVGGTNTDAVLMGPAGVLGKIKTPTTADVMTGIVTALAALLEQTRVGPTAVTAVMIGTTHFTNAVVERRRLRPVAAVRLGLPATACLPPMVDWPADLAEVVGGHRYLVHGGIEFDGRTLSELDEAELALVGSDLRARGITAAAITSVFSPINGEQELRAGAILARLAPGLDVTCSHEIGRIGLLERENAAILNACLRDLARTTIASFEQAIRQLDLGAKVYLTQNDGALMTGAQAERFPVLTFASGPTNSMRGAAYLSGLGEAIVVDIGGTTTDVGALTRGFPRQAALAIEVGGVRTNFRMPDVHATGLGGGSRVRIDDAGVTVGPDSVGYELTRQARVFGGETLTATDIAVAGGAVDLGDARRVADLAPEVVERVTREIGDMIDLAVDRVRLSAEPLPVIVVGGGRILVSRPIAGASELVVPEHFEAANAVGAAIAQVTGEVDRVVALAGSSRAAALEAARGDAVQRAIGSGADPATIEVLDMEDVPLAYLPGNAVRVRVKVVGELVSS